jgi:hypothetical protein
MEHTHRSFDLCQQRGWIQQVHLKQHQPIRCPLHGHTVLSLILIFCQEQSVVSNMKLCVFVCVQLIKVFICIRFVGYCRSFVIGSREPSIIHFVYCLLVIFEEIKRVNHLGTAENESGSEKHESEIRRPR